MKNLKPYAKTVVAAAFAVAYAILSAAGDGTITNTEWVGIAALAAATLGVYSVPNKPPLD